MRAQIFSNRVQMLLKLLTKIFDLIQTSIISTVFDLSITITPERLGESRIEVGDKGFEIGSFNFISFQYFFKFNFITFPLEWAPFFPNFSTQKHTLVMKHM